MRRTGSSSSTSRMVSVPRSASARRLGLAHDLGRDARQEDLEGGPLARARCRPRSRPRSAARFRRRSTRPRPVPLPCSLVVKNGSKIRACVARPSRAGVADREHDVGARPDRRCAGGVGLVELRVAGLDGQLASRGHRVARVDRQVHDHLLEAPRVDLHQPERAARHRGQLDVLPQHRRSIFSMLGEHVVEVEHLRLEHLLAAEGQELPGELRGAPPRLPDFLRSLAERSPGFSSSTSSRS